MQTEGTPDNDEISVNFSTALLRLLQSLVHYKHHKVAKTKEQMQVQSPDQYNRAVTMDF